MTKAKTIEICKPWDAFIAPSTPCKIEQAVDKRVSCSYRIYPPGSPRILSGQVFTQQHLDEIKDAVLNHDKIVGLSQNGANSDLMIDVLNDSAVMDKKFSIKTHKQLNRFTIETVLACDVSREMVLEIADFYGCGFGSVESYSHFAAHQDDPFLSLPPSLDFKAWDAALKIENASAREVRKQELLVAAKDVAKPWYNYEELNDIFLPDGFHRWADQELTRSAMLDRFKDPGYVSTVRCVDTGELRGLLHARTGSLERMYFSEEWSDACKFSKYCAPELVDDPKRFFSEIHKHLGLSPTDELIIISAQLLHPDALGGAVYYKMMRSMAQMLRPQDAGLALLCEIPAEGSAHLLNVATTRKVIYDVLKNGHPLVYSERASEALFYYIAKKEHLTYAVKNELKKRRKK